MSLGPTVRLRPLDLRKGPAPLASPWCEESTPEFLEDARSPVHEPDATPRSASTTVPAGACRGILLLAGLAASSHPDGEELAAELRQHLRAHLYGSCWSAAARAGRLPPSSSTNLIPDESASCIGSQ